MVIPLITINDSSCFEDERLARKIAGYMLGDVYHNTYSGSYFYSFDEINRLFGTWLPNDDEMVDYIIDAILLLLSKAKKKASVKIYTIEGFDLVFKSKSKNTRYNR